jgi:hypothetical protein
MRDASSLYQKSDSVGKDDTGNDSVHTGLMVRLDSEIMRKV